MMSFLSLLLTFPAFAQVVSVDKPALESQRLHYEKYMTEKLEKNLNNLVEEGSYVINVSIQLKNLPAEQVKMGASGETQENSAGTVLNVQKEFNGEEGLVPLSKLGIWPSLLSKNPTSNNNSSSYSQRLRNFTELIGKIQIDIIVDQQRNNPQQIEIANTVISELVRGSLPVNANLNFRSMNLGTVAKSKENLRKELLDELKKQVDQYKDNFQSERNLASLKKSTVFDKVLEFKEVIGTLIATVFIFLLGLIVSKRYASIQEKRLAMEESLSMRGTQSVVGAEESQSIVEDTAVGKEEPDSTEVSAGFKQFSEIISRQPERAVFMLKQWLYGEDEPSKAILSNLPRILSLEELNTVINLLNEADRKNWNRINDETQQRYSLKEINTFLLQRISVNLIEPDAEISKEIRELLASMSPQEGVLCIQTDPEIGALLALTMSSFQYTKILSLLDRETIKKIALVSSQLDPQKVQYTAIKTEKVLNELRKKSQSQSSVFIDKAPQLIRDLGVSKEDAIFESVAEMGQAESLIEISFQFFPAKLIPKLPTHIIEIALGKLSLVEKAELMAAFPDRRDFLFEGLGKGKLQEILMVEIEEIEMDKNRHMRIQQSKDKKWQLFINRIRDSIQSDPSLQNEVAPLINEWSQKMVNEKGRTNAA